MADLSQAEKTASAVLDALVADVVATARAHPEYANLVNRLTETALQAALAAA